MFLSQEVNVIWCIRGRGGQEEAGAGCARLREESKGFGFLYRDKMRVIGGFLSGITSSPVYF